MPIKRLTLKLLTAFSAIQAGKVFSAVSRFFDQVSTDSLIFGVLQYYLKLFPLPEKPCKSNIEC